MELGFRFVDPAEVADARLQYDVWLVRRARDGRELTDRVRTSGYQGATVDYRFTLFHGTDGLLLNAEHDGALRTTISGEIKGRARQDGLIELTLEAMRLVLAEGSSVGRGSGITHLRVRPGETLELALPPVGRLRDIDLADILRGQSTAIRITTTRVR